MTIINSGIDGGFVIKLDKIEDERGFFSNIWSKQKNLENKMDFDLTECNIAFNKIKGTVRGLHYQISPYQGAKLVRCSKGKIFDIVLDLRPNSKTFKKWTSIELSSENYKMNYIPKGCAHGYQTLEDNSEVTYLMSQEYNLEYERGANVLDPQFAIKLPLEIKMISKKDRSWGVFNQEPKN